MTRRFTQLAWAAATATYLLIILGAIVRITGSGMGCGDHWPLCNGSLLPPLDLPTMIEYGHRLAAAAVSVLVVALAAVGWWGTRGVGSGAKSVGSGEWFHRVRASYIAVVLLVIQILLGAITVKLELPAWTIILHLGTAMLLLAALLVAARLTPSAPGAPPSQVGPSRATLVAAALGLATVLMGALTANMAAATACQGFPLCNGSFMPTSGLEHIHWTHRLLAYALFAYVIWWAVRSRVRGAWYVVGLVTLQVVVAAAMVLLALPPALQAAHVAVGAAVWAALVLAAL